MAEPNPIERRLGLLREQYMAFVSDEQARLLRWRLAEDERRMLDAFVQVEAIEGQTEDLLLLLDSPFEDPGRYGMALVAEIAELYEALREPLGAAGMADTSWGPPPPPRSPNQGPLDIAYLRGTAASFHEHHQPLLRHLSLLLHPKSVSDRAAFTTWLNDAVQAFDDPSLRLVLAERIAFPVAHELSPPPQVHTVDADLDMPGALVELNEEAGVDDPPGQFRQAYLEMGNAMGRRDIAAAVPHADRAVAIAQSQGWGHLVVAAHTTLASGHVGVQQYPEAMERYRRADVIARDAHDAGERWGLQLMLQARLGSGSVCVATASWPLGAEIYGEQARPVAEAMGDLRMQLETQRMAAYCNEQRGEIDAAWEQSVAALAIGDRIPQEDRSTTTLAFVGEAMLRMCEHRSRRGQAPVVEREMTRLLGPAWREQARPGEPPDDVNPNEPSPLESNPPPVETVPPELSEPSPTGGPDA
ncbi:MAG: hypothetical protein AAF799_19340 [Myxococcota bacterium]